MNKNRDTTDDTVDGNGGLWIGIDLGTSNSTCGVWDSNRGSPKWIRLPIVATPTTNKRRNGKIGRIMPSIVSFTTTKSTKNPKDDGDDDGVLVGQQVIEALKQQQQQQQNDESSSSSSSSSSPTSKMTVFRSVKRLLGKRYGDLDPNWITSLDFDIVKRSTDERGTTGGKDEDADDDEEEEKDQLQLIGRTMSSTTMITTCPVEILSLELRAIRQAAQSYVDKYMIKKNLKIPGSSDIHVQNNKGRTSSIPIRNVVVGVPAHYSQRHIRSLKEAVRRAGFTGHIGTCLESTAAAMAYGMALQEQQEEPQTTTADPQHSSQPSQVLMVIDMGGGTTDITIARKKSMDSRDSGDGKDGDVSSYEVLVTEGDDRLGGDDIDQSMIEYCIGQLNNNKDHQKVLVDPDLVDRQQLRSSCRQAKELLCQDNDNNNATSSVAETIVVHELLQGEGRSTNRRTAERVKITQSVFEVVLTPWSARAKDLIVTSKTRLSHSYDCNVNEVVLVGETTRIPALRRMIQSLFPNVELATSLNPMSSVAQGLAIQAAISSKLVPLHELKSAMMLDCVPHAIGVLLNYDSDDESSFVEIIRRNQRLPARGSATFTLADKEQPGVTIRAVEKIGDNEYERMSKDEDFTFLLKRLSPRQLDELRTTRSIEVGMAVESDGKFIVSIFDELDPEQVRMRERYEKVIKGGNEDVVGELGYIKDLLMDESGFSTEQVMLVGTLVGLIVLYVAVRVAFTDPTIDGAMII